MSAIRCVVLPFCFWVRTCVSGSGGHPARLTSDDYGDGTPQARTCTLGDSSDGAHAHAHGALGGVLDGALDGAPHAAPPAPTGNALRVPLVASRSVSDV